jgi:pilus assembly protein CpaD
MSMTAKSLFHRTTGLTACALGILLTATAPLGARTVERGVEPVHQPRVERTDFVFDVAAGSNGALDSAERRRLSTWFDALGLRYGDHVSFAGAEGFNTAGLTDSVATVVARYGLLTEGDAPITAGKPPMGSLRVVVSRSTASVPGCPSWRGKTDIDFIGGLSDNYGCASAGNLAAMIADPQDLIEGRHTETELRSATSSRAIKTYQDKAPTGSGALQAMAAGGS